MAKMTILEGNSNDKDNVKAYMVKGEPGVSPTIDVSKEDGVTTLTIEDAEGTHTATIADGDDLVGGVPTDGVIGFDGEVTDIPDGYEVLDDINLVKSFNTITEMKEDEDLVAGDTCQTLGYYSANDGGAGLYKIVDDSQLVDDGGSIHELANGLKAQLISNKKNVCCYGILPNNQDNSQYMNRIKGLETIYIPDGNYKFSNPITIENTNIICEKVFFEYTGEMNTEDTFITFNGNSAPQTPLSGKIDINKLFINCNGKIQNGCKIENCYSYNINELYILGVIENGLHCTRFTNGTIRKCYIRRLPTNIESIGVIIDNADSIYDNLVTVDFKYGIKCNQGNNRITNFHSWLSSSELYSGSTCILMNTYSPIIITNLTCDTVQTVVKTLNNYARFSITGLTVFNNTDVVNEESNIVLDLFGTSNYIVIEGSSVTSQNAPLKFLTDSNFANVNTYLINGNIVDNVVTEFKTNNITEIGSSIKFLSTINSNSNIVLSDLSKMITNNYNGLFAYNENTIGSPASGSSGIIFSVGMNTGRGFNIAIDTNNNMYYRFKTGNKEFTVWKKVTAI